MKDVNEFAKPIFEIKDVHFKVENKEILKGINLLIKKGEIRSIVGVNGTGKTTVAAIVMGLEGYVPSRGKILFNGYDITNLSVTERAKLGITLAWQSPAVFEGITVRDYLSIGDPKESPEELLKLVGFNPDLYLNRIVDDNLSGGERKRIELASVYAMKPKLLILDEPDSGIDMASLNTIKTIITNLKEEGTAVLLITHNEKIAKIGDKGSLLCGGKVLKEGTIKDVTDFFKKFCKGCGHVGKIDKKVL